MLKIEKEVIEDNMYGIYEDGRVIANFVAPITVRSNQPTTVSDTLSLKRQAVRRVAQRWEITASLEPFSDDAQDLLVNLVTRGHSETVIATMPQNVGAFRNTTSTSTSPTISASYSANATQLNVTNLIGRISKGTFIKFSNHSKVYMLTQDITNNGTLNIFPSLRTSVPQNTTFTFKKDVLISCMYDTDTVTGMVYSDGILMDVGTITLVEKL